MKKRQRRAPGCIRPYHRFHDNFRVNFVDDVVAVDNRHLRLHSINFHCHRHSTISVPERLHQMVFVVDGMLDIVEHLLNPRFN